MKFSYNWLKDLSNTKKTPEELAELLTLKSFEVEAIEKLSKNLDKVIVGEVLNVEKHPDADKLNVARVNVGEEELQIVCGAPNLKAGQRVPVALVGAVLGEGFEIKKANIRGIESSGMICAEDELGLGEDHEGIMVLDKDAPVGESFSKYLGLDDFVLDIDILPNRAHDALSHEGVAREISALQSSKYKVKSEKLNDIKKEGDAELSVSIGTEKCKRYIGIKIENVKIGESPAFIKSKLLACGLKPINNIVDITNYVMLETGQPLHAFDAKGIENILARQAKKGEDLVLLEDSRIELDEKDVVITDGEKPVALAGIMGGKNSGINKETRDVVLEAASFDDVSIRISQRRRHLHTDAGHRFERELDPNLTEHAAIKAAKLIMELAQGEVTAIEDVYPEPIIPWSINLDTKKVNSLLGAQVEGKDIVKILEDLGIRIQKKEGDILTVTIPTRRIDLQNQEDLIEEIGRIYGYEKIIPIPLQEAVRVPHRNEKRFLERSLRDLVSSNGFDEVRGYSFYSREDAQGIGLDDEKHVTLMNPMNKEQEIVRRSLSIELLKSIKKSLSYFDELNIFDIGKVYNPADSALPQERLLLSLAVADKNQAGEQFFVLKGVLDEILYKLKIDDYYLDPIFDENTEDTISFHPSRKALVKTRDGETIGNIGEVTKKAYKYFGLKKVRVAVLELDINHLLEKSSSYTEHNALLKFPEVERDLSLIVGERTLVADVERVIYLSGKDLISDIDLFDLYVEKGTGERSMAFHIRFSNAERTLTAKEVDTKISEIINSLEKELGIAVKTNQ